VRFPPSHFVTSLQNWSTRIGHRQLPCIFQTDLTTLALNLTSRPASSVIRHTRNMNKSLTMKKGWNNIGHLWFTRPSTTSNTLKIDGVRSDLVLLRRDLRVGLIPRAPQATNCTRLSNRDVDHLITQGSIQAYSAFVGADMSGPTSPTASVVFMCLGKARDLERYTRVIIDLLDL